MKLNLLPYLNFQAFYPDDFINQIYKCISIYGEVASDSERNELKRIVYDDYAIY